MIKRKVIIVCLVVLFLAGCAKATQGTLERGLELKVRMTMEDRGKLSVSTGLHNAGIFSYQGTENYNGILTILDKAGKLRALNELNSFDQLAADETYYPLTYDLNLEPGSYQLKYSALGKQPVEVAFEVYVKDGNVYLNAPQEFVDSSSKFISTTTP